MLQTRSIESYSFRYSSFCSFVCMKPPLYPDSSLMDAEILSHVLYSVRVKSIYSYYLVQFKYNNRVLFLTIYQVLRKIFQVQFFPLCVINIYIYFYLFAGEYIINEEYDGMLKEQNNFIESPRLSLSNRTLY